MKVVDVSDTITKDRHPYEQFNSKDKLADDTVVAVRTKFEIVVLMMGDVWPKMMMIDEIHLDTTTDLN